MADPRDEIIALYNEAQSKYGVSARRELRQKLKQKGYRESLTREEYNALLAETRPITQQRPSAAAQVLGKQADAARSTPSSFQPTPEEMQRSSILYTGEDKINITSRQTAEQDIKKARAGDVVEQYQLKQAFPGTSAQATSLANRFGGEAQIEVRKPEQKTVTRTEVVSDPINVGYESRAEKLVQREARLREFQGYAVEKLGLKKTPEEEKISFNLKSTGLGLAKSVGQIPIYAAGAPVFIGGRVAFAVDSLFNRQGRQELVRAAKATPKTIAQSYNPTTTSGLVNIGLTAIAVKKLGDYRVAKRQQVTVSAQGYSTKRITTKDNVIDTTKGRVEALYGKKKVVGEFKGQQTFTKINNKEYLGKSSGTIKISGARPTKTLNLEGRSITIIKDQSAATLDITKVGRQYYLTSTKSQTLQYNPQLFRTLSATKVLKPKTSIFGGKEEAISTGITKEVFTRNVLTESGKYVSTEQILRTGRISMGSKTFDYYYELPKGNIPISTNINQGTAQATIQRSTLQSQSLAGTTTAKVTKAAAELKTAATGSSLTVGGYALTGLKLEQPKTTTKVLQTTITKTKILPTTKASSITTAKTTTKPITSQSVKPFTISEPKQTILPTQATESVIKSRQEVQPLQVQGLSLAQTQTSPNIVPGAPVVPIAPQAPITPLIPQINLPMEYSTKRKQGKRTSQAKRYRPSLIGIQKNIKGRRKGLLTGLEVRGL